MSRKKSKSIKVKDKRVKKKRSKIDGDNKDVKAELSLSDNSVFVPLLSLRREIDDIFNQLTNRFGIFTHDEREDLKIPAMNVEESETTYEISAELPGVAEKDIDVSLTDTTLSICGTREKSKETTEANRRVSEFSSGSYERTLTLPFAANATDVEAEYSNGVLHITIPKPKTAETKPQKIAVKSAA